MVNCAAYTAVDRAEEGEDLARVVNGEAVGELAACCSRTGIPFVTYSTDYVFDGGATGPYLESDPPKPINAYGRTKLVGERLALELYPESLVIRTSWVVSGTHPNFVATMVRKARHKELRVVNDQHGCPTVVDDLARGTLAALRQGAGGLLHLTNQGPTTWYRLAAAAVELAGLDPDRVQPCSSAEYPTRARRPAYSVLRSRRLEELGLESLPPWPESPPGVVRQLMEWV